MVKNREGNNLGKELIVSLSNAPYLPDGASNGTLSRWLQNDSIRMRIVTLPSGYEGDHTCYKGHSIYTICGFYKMELEDSVSEWKEGDAFIIPDGVPHRLFNPNSSEAKVIIFDNHLD